MALSFGSFTRKMLPKEVEEGIRDVEGAWMDVGVGGGINSSTSHTTTYKAVQYTQATDQSYSTP